MLERPTLQAKPFSHTACALQAGWPLFVFELVAVFEGEFERLLGIFDNAINGFDGAISASTSGVHFEAEHLFIGTGLLSQANTQRWPMRAPRFRRGRSRSMPFPCQSGRFFR